MEAPPDTALAPPAAHREETTARSTGHLLRHRALRRLFAARGISVLGDMLAPVALAFAVLESGGGASGLGTVLAARAVPSIGLVLIGGVIGDRYPRRAVMAWSSLGGFATQAACGAVILLHHAPLWAIAALAAVRGATGAFFNPASTAAVAEVAPEGRLQETYSLFSLVGNTAEIAGPVLAGLLLAVADPGWILLADAATFLAGAALVVLAGPLGNPPRGARKPVVRDIAEGLRCVAERHWLAALILSATAFQFFLLSALNVLGPVVARDHLGGASAWAVIVTALGSGGLCGTALSLKFRPTRPLRTGYLVMVLGAGPTLLLLAVPASLPLIAVSEFVSGAAIALFTAMESAAIAKEVPRELLSRVDAVNRFGSMALRPLGMAVIGPLAAACGTTTTLICAAAASLAAMLIPLAVKDVRALTA
ncbi:transmembrane secretion effector [Streptomyces sp. TLI_235]|nr:MFS transporter [Streptomyces sp. TLI_235]PBC70145.1 transmembrane secretion effector [Streptomyces sp. TLI_235]